MRLQLDWDTENRLVRVAPESGREQSGDLKVEFEYDYRNRRVARRVYTWDGAEWDLTAGRKYVWDGWRLLLELDAGGETLMVLRAYTWGLDLAGLNGAPSRDRQGAGLGGAGILPVKPTAVGLLEGAGGIGGLLAAYDANRDRPLWYFYDANGNVGQVVRMISVGGPNYGIRPAAPYEYDPYGNRTNEPAQGEYEQPFQYSTKQWDPETGLLYFGLRYRDRERWISRDPIEETGAVLVRQVLSNTASVPRDPVHENVYAFSMNAPTDYVDPDGWSAQKGGKLGKGGSTPPESQPGEKPAGRGATCGLKIKRSAICTLSPKQPCDFGHEWIEGGGSWDYPKDYADDPCHEWDRNHPVWEWNAHVRLFGGSLPNGTSCASATCGQIRECLQKAEDEWAGTPYNFFKHSCINFVDAALSKCCMARGALPTRMPKLFEEAKLCCERCKWMNEHGCNGGPGPGGGSP